MRYDNKHNAKKNAIYTFTFQILRLRHLRKDYFDPAFAIAIIYPFYILAWINIFLFFMN